MLVNNTEIPISDDIILSGTRSRSETGASLLKLLGLFSIESLYSQFCIYLV